MFLKKQTTPAIAGFLMGEIMSKEAGRKAYKVLSRYRSGGLWNEQDQELNLLPVQAAGPLSQGKIELKQSTKTNKGSK